jgi:hypothetical protein
VESQSNQDLAIAGQTGELLRLDRIVDDEGADPGAAGMLDIGGLLDRMGVDAAVRRDPQRPHRVHFGVRGDVEAAATRLMAVSTAGCGNALTA